jgi:hypothetical protein
MTTIKSYTDLEQSKKLAEILPLESADMWWAWYSNPLSNGHYDDFPMFYKPVCNPDESVPCWSLAALIYILHAKEKDIPSLSGGGYKDGKYISDWCLDYEFDDGDYKKTFADNPVDVCYEMIIKLHELKKL